MSVHDVCTQYAGGCLRGISSVSPWYPLVGIPIGVGTLPPLGQTGPSIAPENWYVGETLPAFNCSEEVFAMDILAESRLTIIPPGPYGPALRDG